MLHSFFLKPNEQPGSLEEIKVWISFLDLFLLDWFFINLQMSTSWKLAFLNSAMIIFCLIYSLNIPHSNQNLDSFFSLESHLANFCEWWGSHKKIILTFLSAWFHYCHGRRTYVCFNDKYKVHSLFIVSRLSS